MTRVLMQLTIILTVGLGILAGAFQMLVDLKQEKDAVEINAIELLESLAPTAAKAVYNFDDHGAQQVAQGLFTQRAVSHVVIYEMGEVFADARREVTPTLPTIGSITTSDDVVITRELRSPVDGLIVGRLEITVDRSIVPPAIVDRMLMYFAIAVLKNFLLGVLLIAVVFGGLARHVLRLANALGAWRPGASAIEKPSPPRFLRGTELDLLGSKIVGVSASATDALQTLERHNEQVKLANTELRGQSSQLSTALEERNHELRRLNQELTEIADRDSLTTLHNRRYFERKSTELWTEAIEDDTDVSVLIFDIDHFKSYNDFYGHQKGDECLKLVAATLQSQFRTRAGLIARYGGEEFIALAPGMSPSDAADFARETVDRVARLRIEHARSLNAGTVTISVGVASRQRIGAAQLHELIGAADCALYLAKSEGRGRAVLAAPDFVTTAQREEQATQALLKGLRTRAFEPFYQPQVDARTGRITGLETLARWRQPDGSVLAPGAFLPKAEALGLTADVDAIIQEKALQQLQDWFDQGIAPGRFSMNMSESRLLSGRLHALVTRFPAINDGRLSFELLESVFVEQQSDVFAMRLDQLRELGCAVEVDDFGTGHTSIVGLATVLPERIKIARELVAPLGVDPRATKVIHAVVEMAQAFEIELVAEGVETDAQAALLIELGCPFQQGYLHGRPAPAAKIGELLRAEAAPQASETKPLPAASA